MVKRTLAETSILKTQSDIRDHELQESNNHFGPRVSENGRWSIKWAGAVMGQEIWWRGGLALAATHLRPLEKNVSRRCEDDSENDEENDRHGGAYVIITRVQHVARNG